MEKKYDNKALFLSRYALFSTTFHSFCEDVTYEDSTVRGILNEECFNVTKSDVSNPPEDKTPASEERIEFPFSSAEYGNVRYINNDCFAIKHGKDEELCQIVWEYDI